MDNPYTPGGQGQAGQPLPRYTSLSETQTIQLQQDVPVALCASSLLQDNYTRQILASCTFQSLADRPIRAMLISLTGTDVWGSPIPGQTEFQYLDLNLRRGALFGRETLIPLTDPNLRTLQVRIRKLLYADGTIVECDGEPEIHPAPVPLAEHLGSPELAQEYARQTTPSAQIVPSQLGQEHWRCTCGSINSADEAACPCCGSTLGALTQVLDPVALEAGLEEFRQAQEKAAAEQAERIRLAEEQVKRERAEQEEKQRIAQAIERRNKKRKQVLAILLSTAAVLVVTLFVLIFWGIPTMDYNRACEALKNKDFDVAYTMFVELGDFKDSPDMAQNCIYEKGLHLLANGDYNKAIAEFKRIPDYKDSADRITEAEYRIAMDYLDADLFPNAYKALVALSEKRDVSEELDECVYAWVDFILSNNDSTQATSFVNTVTLTASQQNILYNALISHLYQHTDETFWESDDNVKTVFVLLNKLPGSKGDVKDLTAFFAELYNYYLLSDEFIRDNYTLLRDLWDYEFVRNILTCDDNICTWLEGYWTTSGSGYYLNFYAQEDGGTYCSYNLPRPSKPYGTKYYEIRDFIWIWTDEDSNELAKVYRITFVNADEIRVFCYQNNSTYTLYR